MPDQTTPQPTTLAELDARVRLLERDVTRLTQALTSLQLRLDEGKTYAMGPRRG